MNLVLGSEMFTRSPSLMSTSPALSPPDSESKPGRLRRKLTKESLKGHYSGPRWSSFSSEPAHADVKTTLRQRATDTGNLNQLYEHYEQTSFRDTADRTEQTAAPANHSDDVGAYPNSTVAERKGSHQSTSMPFPAAIRLPRHHVAPAFGSVAWRPAYSPDEGCGPIAENPRVSASSSNLASPAGDYTASVSSRHTRTSRASKTTEGSAGFDYNANSILSLSSDSEDDGADLHRIATSKSSVGSRDSVPNHIDLRRKASTSSVSVEPPRAQLKSRFRTSMGSTAPFLAIPEDEGLKGGSQPKINPRSSSLCSNPANSPRPSISTVASSVQSQSRLSQVSISTSESISTHFSRPRSSAAGASPEQAPEINHIAMQSRTVTPTPRHHQRMHEQHQSSSLTRLSSTPRHRSIPPMSPSSMDFVIRGQHDSTPDHDGPILTLSSEDPSGEERFIAVTPQEEMLLSAMRAKRAMMRENQQSGDVDVGLKSQRPAEKESLSSIKTVKTDSLELAPRSRALLAWNSSKKLASALQSPEAPVSRNAAAPPTPRPVEISVEENILESLDRAVNSMDAYDNAEPSPDLSDFIIDFDAEQFPAPPTSMHSRESSTASAAGRLTHSRRGGHHRKSSFGRPRPDSEFLPQTRHASPTAAPPLPYHKGADLEAVTGRGKQPQVPSSPPTFMEQETPQPPSRKKAVRISAVGLAPPEIGQWGDDG